MSSVVAETSSKISAQATQSKSGKAGQGSKSDGFSEMVDENLSASKTGDSTASSEARPSSRAHAKTPDAPAKRRDPSEETSRPETEAASKPNDETTASEAAAESATAEKPKPAVKVDLLVKLGEDGGEAKETKGEAETTPQTATAGTPDAIAVALQIGLSTGTTDEAAADGGEKPIVVNPPATVVSSPATLAASALAKVASDIAASENATGTSIETETEAKVAIPLDALTVEPPPTDAALEVETKPMVQVETAAADTQLDAKADAELSKTVDAEPLPQKPVEERAETKPTTESKQAAPGETERSAPKQRDADSEGRDNRRTDTPADTKSASARGTERPVEPETRSARAASKESQSTPPAQAQTGLTDHNQTNGFVGLNVAATQTASTPSPVMQLAAQVATTAAVPLNGLAVEIAANVQVGRSRFEIRLDPPELGRIDVRLDVDRQGQVTSHLIVDKSATLDLLRRDAQQLERALQDAGLKTSDNGLQFSLRDQQQSGRQGEDGNPRNGQRLVVTEEEAVVVETAGRSYARMAGQRGGIDIRV